MKNDSPQNFNCEFAPEIVDFVYGEMDNDKKNVFDLHLNNCSNCADEIQDFSGIRFSIRDWKSAEFDKLATPEIKIPYQTMPVRIAENVKSAGWFDAVRSYLTLSPVMSGALAVVLLAFVTVVGILIFDKQGKDTMAVADVNPNINSEPLAVPQKSTEPAQETVKNDFEETEIVPVDQNDKNLKVPNAEKRVAVQIKNRTIQKQKFQAAIAVEANRPEVDSLNAKNDSKAATVNKKLRLNELPEEVEDNSLRLTDLFAELESRK